MVRSETAPRSRVLHTRARAREVVPAHALLTLSHHAEPHARHFADISGYEGAMKWRRGRNPRCDRPARAAGPSRRLPVGRGGAVGGGLGLVGVQMVLCAPGARGQQGRRSTSTPALAAAPTTVPAGSTSSLKRGPLISLTRARVVLGELVKNVLCGQVLWNRQVTVCARETFGKPIVAAAATPAPPAVFRNDRRPGLPGVASSSRSSKSSVMSSHRRPVTRTIILAVAYHYTRTSATAPTITCTTFAKCSREREGTL